MRAILTYHSIDPSGSVISVDVATFRRHVAWLTSGSVRVVTLAEVLDAPLGDRCVALTFDDGFANFATEAWPALRDRGLPATVFIVTDRVGTANDWEDLPGIAVPRLELLDWDTLGRLAEDGVALGSHTATHPRLDRLDAAHVTDELGRSAETIRAHTGVRPLAVAYPYGAVTGPIARLAGSHYKFGCTTELRELRTEEDPTLLPRLDAYYFRDPHRLMQWGTGRLRAQLWLRRQARSLRHRWRN